MSFFEAMLHQNIQMLTYERVYLVYACGFIHRNIAQNTMQQKNKAKTPLSGWHTKSICMDIQILPYLSACTLFFHTKSKQERSRIHIYAFHIFQSVSLRV